MAGLTFGTMSFEIDGERHSLDVATIKASEWKTIKTYTGKRPLQVLTEIDDPDSLEAIYWLVNRRAGNTFDLGSRDFDALAFLASVDHIEEPETAPKGSAPKSAKPRKSSPSE